MKDSEGGLEGASHQLVPASVILASAILATLALNHLVMRALPTLMALDPYGLLQLCAVFMCMTVVWGFLTLRRWAWMAGVILSGVGCIFPIFAMQDIDTFQLQSGLHGHTVVIQFLLFLELSAFSVFALLMQDHSKAAFSGRMPRRPSRQQDLPATATQTVHG
ncbi:MAG: hypothetical protein V1929_10295 [bacterium]